MAKIEKLEKVISELRSKAAKAMRDNDVSVAVGYTSAVALYVHENRQRHAGQPRKSGIGVYWGPHGRPGFLLDVAREMSRELGGIVRTALKRGATLAQSLLMTGLRLQRESQKNTPVEFGHLSATAFTRLEKGEE